MPNYRRNYEGGTYFFTVVTYHRLPILTTPDARRLLRAAWLAVGAKMPFAIDAVCLLPNHIHCIWTLPENDQDYSMLWQEIKRIFTQRYLCEVGAGEERNLSRQKRGEAAIWQRRFWEHTLRDEQDLSRHIDYIHYNPVKHGLVDQVRDWPWSSFHRYVRMGYYASDWGQAEEKKVIQRVGE